MFFLRLTGIGILHNHNNRNSNSKARDGQKTVIYAESDEEGGQEGGRRSNALLSGEELLAEVLGQHGDDGVVGQEHGVALGQFSLGLKGLVVLAQFPEPDDLMMEHAQRHTTSELKHSNLIAI
jgi:hypothetical protein